MTIIIEEMCFYHARAREISIKGERELFSAERDCYYGCNGKETCSGKNLHRGEEGDQRYCNGYISVSEAASGNCFHKIKSKGMQRRKQPLKELQQNCLECEEYSEGNHRPCYLDIREILEHDKVFYTRSLRPDNPHADLIT